ncbi:hypothetical protein MBFIL_14320 [Methanobrevibacter filiformis]|uniref:Uncharacterized protein n=1 Tax=Methanobrevibacter filiformis TaxID=55758 RepID=A0A166A3G9_9EURY|nr:hypothetical protein MBFIL_14320 [Methanobrevibacter filiformis]
MVVLFLEYNAPPLAPAVFPENVDLVNFKSSPARIAPADLIALLFKKSESSIDMEPKEYIAPPVSALLSLKVELVSLNETGMSAGL